MEPTEQTPLTPTAFRCCRHQEDRYFRRSCHDDDDEPWASEPITGQAGTKRSRAGRIVVACCMELFCEIIRNKLSSLAKAKSVPANIREFLSWAQRHYRIDVTASTVEGITGRPASAGACPGGCKEFSRKGSNAHFIRLTCKICGTVRREERHPLTTRPSFTCSHRHMDHRRSNAHTRKTHCVDCGTYIDSVPREIYNALEATRSASSNRNEELADRVSRDTTITKQQIDLATRLMLEQVSRLSDGDL